MRVGHTTLIAGDGPLIVGKGPVRTGVTVVIPHGGHVGREPVFAGGHVLNGNGEMTGLIWVDESGLLTTPVAITNTYSVGVVRDAIVAYDVARGGDRVRFSEAVAEATEEAIVNALCMATTTTGVDGRTAHAVPLDRLREVMRHYRRLVE